MNHAAEWKSKIIFNCIQETTHLFNNMKTYFLAYVSLVFMWTGLFMASQQLSAAFTLMWQVQQQVWSTMESFVVNEWILGLFVLVHKDMRRFILYVSDGYHSVSMIYRWGRHPKKHRNEEEHWLRKCTFAKVLWRAKLCFSEKQWLYIHHFMLWFKALKSFVYLLSDISYRRNVEAYCYTIYLKM